MELSAEVSRLSECLYFNFLFLFINDAADRPEIIHDSGDNNLQDFPADLAQKIRSLSKKIVPQICEFDKIVKPPFFYAILGKKAKSTALSFCLFFAKRPKFGSTFVRLLSLFPYELCGRTFSLLARLKWMMSYYAAVLSANWMTP